MCNAMELRARENKNENNTKKTENEKKKSREKCSETNELKQVEIYVRLLLSFCVI